MKLAISIVSYNTADLLQQCLERIYGSKPKTDFEIWVVDNDSQDNSVAMIKSQFKKVKLIDHGQNVGFGAGHNIALRQIKADYIMMLNPDATLPDGAIDGLIAEMDNNPKIGILSCRIVDVEGQLQPNWGDLPFGWALISWLFNLDGLIKPSFHRTDPQDYQTARQVGWLSGALFLMRRQTIEQIGLWNEDYFMYFEDTEYCYRAQQAGWQVKYMPDFTMTHIGGASSDDPHFNQWKGEFWGLIHFYYQQFGWLAGFSVKLLVISAILLRIFAYGLLGRFKYSKTYLKILSTIIKAQ